MRQVGGTGWYVIDEIDIVTMVADHAGLAGLCSDLEACADALPIPPGSATAWRLCEALERQVPAHEMRERMLVDRLFGGPMAADPTTAAAREHIRSRCIAQVVHAQDLAAVLGSDGAPVAPDTLGYMLRNFFEACRTDMAFEELTILKFAGERLTASARALLTASFEERCNG